MKRILMLFFVLVLITGCANSVDSSLTEYEGTISSQNAEIEMLEEKIKKLTSENEALTKQQVDLSGNLQVLDHKSRNIMKFIHKKSFEELEGEFQVVVELLDEKNVIFDGNESEPFPIKLASLPMYLGYYNPHADGTEVGYYIYDEEQIYGEEQKYLIAFSFGKNNEFKYIASGDR